MRLAALGFSHETNTFAGTRTGYDAFERTGIYRGAAVAQALAASHSTMAGYLEAGGDPDVEVVPLIFAHTEPSGIITRDAFERIAAEMLQMLRDQGPWDGVLLAQHGAAVSEEHADADGEIVARVRALVGPAVPIGLSLDMHANMTRRMVEHVTVTVLYRTNPHLDPRPRALECARLIIRTVRGEIRPAQAIETPPIVVNILKQHTGSEPMKSVVGDLKTVLRRPGMLSASAVMGYPYADVEEMGMSFVAVHDGEATAAAGAARWLARRAWARRAEFQGSAPSPQEALKAAMEAPRGPVVLMDVGDNIGGGSPGDSTVLLAAARRLGVRSFLQSLYDPEAVAACIAAGVRSRITLRVGAKTDRLHGDPVEVTGTVRTISDGRFEEPEPRHGGLRYFDGGPTVVLETADGHTLLLTSRRVASTSLQQLYTVGIRPEAMRAVVAKGVVAPRAAYEPIAAEIVLVDTPGVTAADFTQFHFEHRRRPLYPFEVDAQYGDV
jgi:microcystin degradation protein MlrC